jgi:circadian clock protein KaiB
MNKPRRSGRRAKRKTKPAYSFKLYVTGATPRSSKAIQNLKTLCEKHLTASYELEVVDIYQQPELAAGQQIIAAPTLVRHFPLPLRKFIGDLSNTDHILVEITRER